MSKEIDKIYVQKGVEGSREGKYYVEAHAKGSGETPISGWYKPEELENIVGKELAEKIVKVDNEKTFSGVDLKVGGKGMIGFYGNPSEGKLGIVGQVAKSLFKQEPKNITLDNGSGYMYQLLMDGKLWDEYGSKEAREEELQGLIDSGVDANRLTENNRKLEGRNKNLIETTQHSITITPEMRQQAQEGQPLFMKDKGLTPMQMSVLDKSDFDKDGNVKPEVSEAIKKEYADIEAKAKADGTWMKAPNGKPSKLNEQQWVQVRSSRFKNNFFGDWQKAYSEFKEGKYKTLSEALTANDVSQVVGENGEPLVVYHNTDTNITTFDNDKTIDGNFWFTSKKNNKESGASATGQEIASFLNIKNPASWEQEDKLNDDQMIRDGFDGKELDGDFVAFNPNQIKSATDIIVTGKQIGRAHV